MAEPSAIPGLIEALSDRNDVVRGAAANALEAMGTMVVAELTRTLQSGNRQARQEAVGVLQRINTDEARAALADWEK